MDQYVVDYINSGKAWVLLGSGPSIEMGYPSWKQLAEFAIELISVEAPPIAGRLRKLLTSQDFPAIFDEAFKVLGHEQVLSYLKSKLQPIKAGKVYELIAAWPISVFLTTNFDDEIQKKLAGVGVPFTTYLNSEDHMNYLTVDLEGAVFKLHGDLRSNQGLILTNAQYQDIGNSEQWQYWRTKMTSVFQMKPIIVIGHSLSDPHIRHVLEAARKGSGVNFPICWIAPDVDFKQSREYLEKYRIRVIPYVNWDGSHSNLIRVIESISQFVFPRTSIRIRDEIKSVYQSSLGPNYAATGFFVFNKLALRDDYEQYRVDVVCVAIQSLIPKLKLLKTFSFSDITKLLGWPEDITSHTDFTNRVCETAVSQGLLISIPGGYQIGPRADLLREENSKKFERARERFLTSLELRIKRNYPVFNEIITKQIPKDIDSYLSAFFCENGLSLATTLLSNSQSKCKSPIPSSVIKFISQAAAQYDTLMERQAFTTVSFEIFTQPEQAEIEYIGRISQGYFAFHALGLFGDVAIERLKNAKETVWIVDSSAQIPALALGASANSLFRNCFSRLRSIGVRLFTTERLLNETKDHFWFANDVIIENGASSYLVLSAAQGQPPFRKSNQFLEGFVRWQAAGNPADWSLYLLKTFGALKVKPHDIENSLEKIGIEIIPFENWPGYSADKVKQYEIYRDVIVEKWENMLSPKQLIDDPDFYSDFNKKAEPEAEALVIVKNEREGNFYILSEAGHESPSWFVSQTSMLNLVGETHDERFTWQPEAFIRFASTLTPADVDSKSVDLAFNTLLLAFSQVGANLLDSKTLQMVFGGVIDQANISINQMTKMYEENLASKYAESFQSVISRIKLIDLPIASIQLANEIAEVQEQRRIAAEIKAQKESERANRAEKELLKLSNVKNKLDEKRRKTNRKSRRNKATLKKKKR